MLELIVGELILLRYLLNCLEFFISVMRTFSVLLHVDRDLLRIYYLPIFMYFFKRWDIIAASVDCRTREERGLEKIAAQSSGSEAKFGPINKSRYGSISSYLSDCSLTSNYNDIPLVHDEETYKILKDAGINDLMAKHVAHLFIR